MEVKGFSSEVAVRMAGAHRKSTVNIYDSRWKIFCSWCGDHDLNPLETTAPTLADFLTYLFKVKTMCVSTIQGYRSVIAQTLKDLDVADMSANNHLRALLTQFGVERPRSFRSSPQWDLSLVMRSLTRAPFEPMREAAMWAVSWKTAFLLALATSKRRSELRALSKKVLHPEDWSSMTLRPLPEFVAKTEVPGVPSTRLQEVTLKGMQSFCDQLEADKTLCPVRATKCYLSRSQGIREGRKELFVPYKPGARQSISPVTISSWIQQTIKRAYMEVSREDAALVQCRAHDLRSMGASWNMHQSIALGDILKAAQWRCHNTFTSYYLKDMAQYEDDILRLGPISVGQVLHLPK